MQKNTHPPSIVSKLSKATTLLAVFATSLSGSLLSAKMDIGQNLPDVTSNTQVPFFANLMKQCRPWRTQKVDEGVPFDTEVADQIPRQPYNGYPTHLPYRVNGEDQIVHTQMPVFVDGTHKLTVGGRGVIELSYPGSNYWETYTISGGSSNTIYLNVSGVNNMADFRDGSAERVGISQISIRITASDISNPIHDIRVMPPGYHNAGRDDFHEDFKKLLQPFTVIRFMNWQRINGSPVTTNNRDTNRKEYYTQTTVDGVAVDHIIDLANEMGKNIWICVPHKMENASGLAYQIATKLNPGITCYVEYSNEVWNGGGLFPQGQWVEENTEGANRHQKYGTRADAVFRTFRNQFQNLRGSLDDLQCVLAGQNGNVWVLEQALITGRDYADCLAIAPYFGTVMAARHIQAITEQGNWQNRTSLSGYYGSDYLDDLNEKTKENGDPLVKQVIFRPDLPSTGDYRVEIRYPASNSNALSVPVTIMHDDGRTTVNVDQRINGGIWNPLGVFRFNAGTYHDVTLSTKNTIGTVVADAIRFVPQGGGAAIIVDNSDDRVFIPTIDELANTSMWAKLPLDGLARHRNLSDQTGLPLIAYEGGQHLVSDRSTDAYPELRDQLLTFNRNWRMKNLYRDVYLDAVNEHGLDLFVHFHLVGQWSKFGSWGAMEFYTQPITETGAVKAWALLDWMNSDTPEPNTPPSITAGPSASPDTITLPEDTSLSVNASDADGDALSYSWSLESAVVGGTVDFSPNASSRNPAASFSIAGEYVLRVTVSDGQGGTDTGTVSVLVQEGDSDQGGNIALNQLAKWGNHSKSWSNGFDASAIVDGDTGTSKGTWVGTHHQYQWYAVDLGTARSLSQVKMLWGGNNHHAVDYEIQVSSDGGASWTTIKPVTNNNAQETDDTVNATTRFLRIKVNEGGRAPSAPTRVILHELEIYGSGGSGTDTGGFTETFTGVDLGSSYWSNGSVETFTGVEGLPWTAYRCANGPDSSAMLQYKGHGSLKVELDRSISSVSFQFRPEYGAGSAVIIKRGSTVIQTTPLNTDSSASITVTVPNLDASDGDVIEFTTTAESKNSAILDDIVFD